MYTSRMIKSMYFPRLYLDMNLTHVLFLNKTLGVSPEIEFVTVLPVY